jgi:general L-amino acid transport system substrate-binding protein
MMRSSCLAALLALVLPGLAQAAAPRAKLFCGVVTEPQDWNKTDLHGDLSPLDTEICRAVATAMFGAPDKLVIQSYSTEPDALAGLHNGLSDMVAGVTPGAQNAAQYGVRFSLPFFQDAQGFMVHKDVDIHAVADISHRKLCYIEDTDNDATVLAWLAARGVRPIPFGFQEEGEMDAAIIDHHCEVTSAYLSKLAEARSIAPDKGNYHFLPDLLVLSPVTAAVDDNALGLAETVDYTISALLQAEFLGVRQGNVMGIGTSADPRMQRLLGQDWATAQGLGLPHDWSRQVIAAVGNYGEIYARSVGPGTELSLPRGLNALWSNGGLLAPLPLR